jgi:hypothetical protein
MQQGRRVATEELFAALHSQSVVGC